MKWKMYESTFYEFNLRAMNFSEPEYALRQLTQFIRDLHAQRLRRLHAPAILLRILTQQLVAS